MRLSSHCMLGARSSYSCVEFVYEAELTLCVRRMEAAPVHGSAVKL